MDKLEQGMERHKQVIRCGVVVFLAVIFYLGGMMKISHVGNTTFLGPWLLRLFVGCGVLGIAFIVVLHWLSLGKEIRIERLFLFSMIVLSLAYMLFFAPVSVPDEQAHYISAYRLSNYFLFHWGQFSQNDILMRQADAEFFGQFAVSGNLDAQSYQRVIENFTWFTGKTQLVTYSANTATNVPLGYVASALGIAVGRLFHLGSLPVFYLGRMFNMAQYIALASVAMRRIPFGKSVIYAISMFPMVLHLCASFSYDCMIIGVSMLFVAEVVRMIYGETISRGQVILCAVLCFVLAPSKLVYTPLLFLVLLIPGEKLKGVFRYPTLLKVIFITAGIVGLLVGQIHSLASYVGEAGGSYVAWAEEEGYSISWVLQNPLGTLSIFGATFLTSADYFFHTMLGGSLGWLQIAVPDFLCLPFAGLFFLACMKKREEVAPVSFLSKCWITILVLGSCGLVFASMFLSWTPISYNVILGIQGRYFLPLLPAVFLIMRNNTVEVGGRMDHHIVFMTGALNVFVLSFCFLRVFGLI